MPMTHDDYNGLALAYYRGELSRLVKVVRGENLTRRERRVLVQEARAVRGMVASLEANLAGREVETGR
jgi:ribosomal protein L30/L7E